MYRWVGSLLASLLGQGPLQSPFLRSAEGSHAWASVLDLRPQVGEHSAGGELLGAVHLRRTGDHSCQGPARSDPVRHLTMAQLTHPSSRALPCPPSTGLWQELLHPWSRVAPQHAHSWGGQLGVPLEHSRLQAQHSLLPRAHSRSLPRGAPSTALSDLCWVRDHDEKILGSPLAQWGCGGEVVNAHGRI